MRRGGGSTGKSVRARASVVLFLSVISKEFLWFTLVIYAALLSGNCLRLGGPATA